MKNYKDGCMKTTLPTINHDKKGFEALVDFYARTKECILDTIEIDMSNVRWFDADMCAIFGALLYRLGDELNVVNLTGISPDVKTILSKNGFLSHYGHNIIADEYGTTISYHRFDIEDDRYFSEYIKRELIHHSQMPEMSPKLLKKFHESIFEIFSNAVLHSETKLGIFSCGQFFPHKERIDFTVADLGIGIRKNIKKHKGIELSPEEAIDWATQESHTTKRGAVPGGLGLKLLCDFIDLNGGSVQIMSNAGYWMRKGGKTEKALLNHEFPGTAVSIEINTADTQSYKLTSELKEEDIF